jgi:hypothetical protein
VPAREPPGRLSCANGFANEAWPQLVLSRALDTLQVGLDVLLHDERHVRVPDAPAQRLHGGACGAAGPASAPGSASGGPPGARRAASAGRAECGMARLGPPGPHLSHRRLSTARIPNERHLVGWSGCGRCGSVNGDQGNQDERNRPVDGMSSPSRPLVPPVVLRLLPVGRRLAFHDSILAGGRTSAPP